MLSVGCVEFLESADGKILGRCMSFAIQALMTKDWMQK